MKYQHTINACFTGYIVQAIVNNFAPLLFLVFQSTYGIPLSKITLLITFNFIVQLLTDLAGAGFIDKIGYRASIIIAHVFSAAGLICLVVLPGLLSNAFAGLLISVMIYAIGGGLLEVLVSPIVEACPTDNKEAVMSLLHSFYCWGHVGVVLLSTIFFTVFGIQRWKILAVLWAVIPIINGVVFTKVPIYPLTAEDKEQYSVKELLKNKVFWLLLLLMICSGASEHSIAQWASTFAESGLHVSKTIGDLAGPMFFAVCMGIARVIYGKYGENIDLNKFMKGSAVLCVFSYLLISLSPVPMLSLLGCGISGLAVGILWPGTFSTASKTLPQGGTAMFALLALGGDVGCSLGPTFVGMVSSAAGGSLSVGILAAIIFPVVLFTGCGRLKK